MVPPAAVVLLDSVTEVTSAHATASSSRARTADRAPALRAGGAARLYAFNDAGIGKDGAGIAALAMLDAAGQPAVAVAHTSARIGEAADTWSAA